MDASLRSRAEQLAGEIASQATTAEALNGLMRLMMKSALERMLDTERDVHLGRKPLAQPAEGARSDGLFPRGRGGDQPAPTLGRSSQWAFPQEGSGELGELTLATPRDRQGTFEPQRIGTHQWRVLGFDEKILALYAKGITARDIQEIVRAVRRRGVGHADFGNHCRPRRGSDGLADVAAGGVVADRVF